MFRHTVKNKDALGKSEMYMDIQRYLWMPSEKQRWVHINTEAWECIGKSSGVGYPGILRDALGEAEMCTAIRGCIGRGRDV